MQKSDTTHSATAAHRKVQASTTLNRRYVKRPVKSTDVMVSVKRSSKVKHFNSTLDVKRVQDTQPVAPAVAHPMQVSAINKMQERTAAPMVSKMTAKELKDQAIKKVWRMQLKLLKVKPKRQRNKKHQRYILGWGV